MSEIVQALYYKYDFKSLSMYCDKTKDILSLKCKNDTMKVYFNIDKIYNMGNHFVVESGGNVYDFWQYKRINDTDNDAINIYDSYFYSKCDLKPNHGSRGIWISKESIIESDLDIPKVCVMYSIMSNSILYLY